MLFLLLLARRQKRPDVFGPGGKNDQTFLGEEAKTTNVACRLVLFLSLSLSLIDGPRCVGSAEPLQGCR